MTRPYAYSRRPVLKLRNTMRYRKMENKESSMIPAYVIKNSCEAEFQDTVRKWQAAPSIEVTELGRVYIVFYGGEAPEVPGNYVKVIISNDGGQTFSENSVIVKHPSNEIRLYDPNLWIDPLGRLWLLWNQGRGFNDGRVGVWASICCNPDAPFSELARQAKTYLLFGSEHICFHVIFLCRLRFPP